MITIDDFKKVDIRVGLVKTAERVLNSDKLISMEVDFGEEQKKVLAGIGLYIEPQNLIGNKYPFVTNLPAREMMGYESQAMILAVLSGDDFSLLPVDEKILPGSRVS